MTIAFSRHQFPPEIIRHAVWLYARCTFSYRNVENLLPPPMKEAVEQVAPTLGQQLMP
jgi:transposase-like protein